MNNNSININDIQSLVSEDLQAVTDAIVGELNSPVALVNQLAHHIVDSGGKRLRPMVVILGAKAVGYPEDSHINLAVAMEFFHTATLLHDDVIDGSALRRGRDTANQIFGSKASILVGDFLFTRAFQLMLRSRNHEVLSLLANVSNTIAKGEVLQLMNCNDPETTEAEYLDVICNKTAILFSAAAQIGSLLANKPASLTETLAEYGMQLGCAFQLVDDALDYCGNSEEIGKNVGDDLAEGKPTLPLIHAMHHGTEQQRELIEHAITEGDASELEAIVATIKATRSIDYTYQRAQEAVDKAITALEPLPASEYKTALIDLAKFAISRTH